MSNTPEQTTAPVTDTETPVPETSVRDTSDKSKNTETAATPAEDVAAPETSTATAPDISGAGSKAPEVATEAPQEKETPAADITNEDVSEPGVKEDADAAEFRRMLEESFNQHPATASGELICGTVVGVDREVVMIDVGGKDEGSVDLQEFEQLGDPVPAIGDEIEVMMSSSGERGGSRFSVLAARRQSIWEDIEASLAEQSTLTGKVIREVKGGLRVQLGGIEAFMPRSESSLYQGNPVEELIGKDVDIVVINASRRPENVVVSRKRPLEQAAQEQRAVFFASARIGARVSGEVKRLTDFGAFIDIGGVDALLHVSDIAWRRLKHPSEALQAGQHITAEIIKLNAETGKVSISMRTLQADPWENVEQKYNAGMRITGTVRRLLDFGAMVELEPGVEGMIHRSEMSWTRRDTNPAKVLSEGDVVDVAVVEVNAEKRRIALSLKEVSENPWQAWLAAHPAGSHVSGKIRSITDFGMFVGLTDELDGLVHLGDLSWKERGDQVIANYSKGQEVECVVLGVDIDRQRISLGIKQLESDPFEVFMAGARRGGHVEGKVATVGKGAASIELMEGVVARLPLREVPRDHAELKAGDEVEAKIIELDRKRRRIGLSISQLLRDEEKDAVRNYSKSVADSSEPSALALELQRKLLAVKEKKAEKKSSPVKKNQHKKADNKPVEEQVKPVRKNKASKKSAVKKKG